LSTVDNGAAVSFASTSAGERVYRLFLEAISDFSMESSIGGGVLLGLSGGADSVMLLRLLTEYRRRTAASFTILAVHVNHGIRGAEADRDEEFARKLAESLGVEFLSRRVDVPSLARERGKGLEETARDARYSIFSDIISSRNDVSHIALGHNATDNLETVIFNMMRGAGARGISGIPPVRDNIIRPMIYIPKADITAVLDASGVAYVTDSTNSDTEYTRNYIRHEIIPRLSKLTDCPEVSVRRMGQNIRVDGEYIDSVAERFLTECGGTPRAAELAELHPAVFYRVIAAMAAGVSDRAPERVHIDKIRSLIGEGSFSYDLPGGCSFVSSCGVCRVIRRGETVGFDLPVDRGVCDLPEYSARLVISDEKAEISHNVYKFSIQADLSSAIICGSLRLRSRRDGDSYCYHGMTHKLKKQLIDAKIPSDLRDRVPLLCDDRGIVWAVGFGVRDDGGRTPTFATLYYDDGGFYVRKKHNDR